MSFSSLLSQVKHKTKQPEAKPSITYSSSSSSPAPAAPSNLRQGSPKTTSYAHKVDPAVQRLKELRRLEKQKEAAEKAKNKPQNYRTTTRSTSAPATRKRKPQEPTASDVPRERIRSASPPKRLTYSELMKQAQDKTKALKTAKIEVSPKPTEHKFVSKTKPQSSQKPARPKTSARPALTLKSRAPSSQQTRVNNLPKPHTDKPIARPSAQLRAKLEAKKKAKDARDKQRQVKRTQKDYHEEDEDEDESEDFGDDFIVDDEEDGYGYVEEEEDNGYDRDEIWKMFNRGKSRRDFMDYDDDLSDMEATGEEVLREEDRAAKRARREELEEQEREKRRIEEKKRRLGKR